MHKHGSLNRAYRVVWNEARGCYMVAHEHATTGGRPSGPLRALTVAAFLSLATSVWAAPAANQLPTGGSVVAGSATISSSGANMAINQSSTRAAIDWQTFNIGAAASVNFQQPTNGVALNRVLDTNASQIYGKLTATGQVFLVNPNGVLFAPGAQVDVGGLVASTQNISTANFMAGNYVFEGASPNAIINQGNITTAPGGTIALIAAKITNDGTLTAQGGNVLLGAGSKVTLDMGGPVKLEVENDTLETLIRNGGAIKADSGTIYLTSQAANTLASSVINNTGLIEAQMLATGEKGQVVLYAHGGNMQLGGTVLADGGSVETSGKTFSVAEGTTVKAASWLIDPVNVTIDSTLASTVGAALGTGDVTISTDGSNNPSTSSGETAGVGDIVVTDPITKTGSNTATLTLQAANDIVIKGGIKQDTGSSTTGKLNLVLRSDSQDSNGTGNGNIYLFGGVNILTNGGHVWMGGGSGSTTWNGLTVGTGAAIGSTAGDTLTNGMGVMLDTASKIDTTNYTTWAAGDVYISGTTNFAGITGQQTVAGINVVNGANVVGNNVTLIGNGGTQGNNIDGVNYGNKVGVWLHSTYGAYVTAQGDLTVTGNGGTSTDARTTTDGVRIEGSAFSYLQSSGALTVTGTGTNYGVGLLSQGNIRPQGDTLDITATSSNPAAGGLYMSNARIGDPYTTTYATAIDIKANSVGLEADSGNSVTGTGTVTIEPLSGASFQAPVYLSGLSFAPTLTGLTVGSVNNTANVAMGVASIAGPITVSGGNITLTDALASTASGGTITLAATASSNPTIAEDTNGSVTADNLLLSTSDTLTVSGASMTLTNANNKVGTLAVDSLWVPLTYVNAGSLTVGTVGTTQGINAGTAITLTTTSGDLTVNDRIIGNGSHAAVSLVSAGKVTAVGAADDVLFSTSNGGLIINAGGDVTVNTNGTSGNLSVLQLTTAAGTTNSIAINNATWALNLFDGLNLGAGSTTTLTSTGTLNLNSAPVNFNSGATTLNLVANKFSNAAAPTNQGLATVSFDVQDHINILSVGNQSGDLLPTSTAKGLLGFNGVKTLVVGSEATNVLIDGPLRVTTASDGLLQLVGNSITFNTTPMIAASEGITVNGGGDLTMISKGALALSDVLVSDPSGTVTLKTNNANIDSTSAANNIKPFGIIHADALVIDSGTGDVTLGTGLVPRTTGTMGIWEDVNSLEVISAGAMTLHNKSEGPLKLNGVTASGFVRIDNPYTDLELDGVVKTTASNGYDDSAIFLDTVLGNFINKVSGNALQVPDGSRWLVASNNPANDTRGDLSPAFVGYAYDASGILAYHALYDKNANDSGFLYLYIPKLTVGLTGTVSKAYDGTNMALLTAANFAVTGGWLATDGTIDTTLTSFGSASRYDTKDVGTHKTVTAGNVHISVSDDTAPIGAIKNTAGVKIYGYSVNPTASGAIGIITQKAISAVSAADKVYDGTNVATLSSSDIISGDDVSVGSGTFAGKNVGTWTVTPGGTLALSGADAKNYTLAASVSDSLSAKITPRTVTLAATKTYDGTTNLTGDVSITTGVSGETLNYTGATASDAHVATADKYIKTITLADGTNGELASNYALPTTLNATTVPVTITAAPISAQAAITGTLTKTYDGTTSATGAASVTGTVTGTVGGDTLAIDASGLTLAYNSAHVADNATNTIGVSNSGTVGFTVSGSSHGSQASDYVLTAAPTVAAAPATITPATLTVALQNTGVTKTYDGTTDAPEGFTPTLAVTSGLVAGDAGATVAVTATGATYDSKDVATATRVTASGLSLGTVTGSTIGSQAGDYALSSPTTSAAASITAKTVTLSATKTYDGTTDLTGDVTIGGLVGTETLTYTGATASDKHVATQDKSISTITLADGSGLASNYALPGTLDASSAPVTITAKTVALTAAKTYDGTTNLTGDVTIGGLAGTETLTYTGATASDAHVATSGKSINAITLADGTGLASDYALPTLSAATAPVTITPATLTAQAAITGATTKTYDGTTATGATVTGAVTGAVAGDTLALDADGVTLNYDATTVAAADSIGATGSAGFKITGSTAGSKASDYAFTAPTIASVAASIDKKTVTAGPVTVTGKICDGTTTATVSGGELTGVLDGDTVSTTLAGTYDTPNAGNNKTVTVALGLSGADAGNYALASATVTATGDITSSTAIDSAVANAQASATSTTLPPSSTSPLAAPPTEVTTDQGTLPAMDVSGGLVYVPVNSPPDSTGSTSGATTTHVATTADLPAGIGGREANGYMNVFVVDGGVKLPSQTN